MARVLTAPPSDGRYVPTAHTSLAVTAETARRSLSSALGFGEETVDHDVPFQRTVRVRCTSVAVVYPPTAQPLVADSMDTAARLVLPGGTVGRGPSDHLDPVQSSTSVVVISFSDESPTAQTSFGATPSMPSRLFVSETSLVVVRVQAGPHGASAAGAAASCAARARPGGASSSTRDR